MPNQPSRSPLSPSDLKSALMLKAQDEGFLLCRTTQPKLPFIKGRELVAFLRAGLHGDMAWLHNNSHRRRSPHALWPQAKTAIMLAMPYHNATQVEPKRGQPSQGVISVYAQGNDYHDVIKSRLKRIGRWLASESEKDIKVFVDTAPIMEKPLAELAGLGWQGKHTNLVSRELGSWFFLGVILSAAKLPFDTASHNHCGACNACIKACPTNAITAPYRLNAKACISYLTIEHKGAIPLAYREAIGNRIYGCDDCLAVCPWNKFAKSATANKLDAKQSAIDPPLDELLRLNDTTFRERFSGSPIKRIGHLRFLRNVLIAAGNSGSSKLLEPVYHATHHDNEMIAETANWAYQKLTNTIAKQ